MSIKTHLAPNSLLWAFNHLDDLDKKDIFNFTVSLSSNSKLFLQVTDKYIWEKSEMRKDKYYMIYITANCICNYSFPYRKRGWLVFFLVMGLLPMLILSILNWLIYRAITRARALHNSLKSGNSHRRDNTMATVLTAIVFVFFICHLPKAALNIYEVGTVRTLNCWLSIKMKFGRNCFQV